MQNRWNSRWRRSLLRPSAAAGLVSGDLVEQGKVHPHVEWDPGSYICVGRQKGDMEVFAALLHVNADTEPSFDLNYGNICEFSS